MHRFILKNICQIMEMLRLLHREFLLIKGLVKRLREDFRTLAKTFEDKYSHVKSLIIVMILYDRN